MGFGFRKFLLLFSIFFSFVGLGFTEECTDQCQMAALYVRHRETKYRPECCTPYYRYYPYVNYYYRYPTQYYHQRYPFSYDIHPHWWWYGGANRR